MFAIEQSTSCRGKHDASLLFTQPHTEQEQELEMIFTRTLAIRVEMMDAIRISHDDLTLTNLRNQLRRTIYAK
jgi:hypothetical protein